MSSNIVLEGFVFKEERQRHTPGWTSSKCYAELHENLTTSKHFISLYSCNDNKKGSKLGAEIELTDLERIYEPKVTMEKHIYDNYICIENDIVGIIFLKFITSGERDEWYNAIRSILTGHSPQQRSRAGTETEADLSRNRIPAAAARNVVSEPTGSGSGFLKNVLAEVKRKIKATPVSTKEIDRSRDATEACCIRQHRYETESDSKNEYLNVHDINTSKEEWELRIQRDKKLVNADHVVYKDFHELAVLQNPHLPHSNQDEASFHKRARNRKTKQRPSASSTKPCSLTDSAESHLHHKACTCKVYNQQPDKQPTTTTNSKNRQPLNPELIASTSEDDFPAQRNDQASNLDPSSSTQANVQDFVPVQNVNGNENVTINQGSGSVLNFITIDLSTEVVDASKRPPKKKRKTTSKILKRLQAESSDEDSCSNDTTCPNCQHLREQNRTLRDLLHEFFREKYGAKHEDTQPGSIVFKLQFSKKADLERFWQAYQSGKLAKELSQLLLRSGLVDFQEDTAKLGVQLKIDESKYKEGLRELDRSSNEVSLSPEQNNEDVYVIQTIGVIGGTATEPESAVPAKRKCVCSLDTNPAITEKDDTYEEAICRSINQEGDYPYEEISINDGIDDLQANPGTSTRVGAELGACSNQYYNYDDVYAKPYLGSRLESVKAFAAQEDSQHDQAFLSELHTERSNLEATPSNITTDHQLFEVNNGFLKYKKCGPDQTFERRIKLDKLIEVTINKYGNIICLSCKHGHEFLHVQEQSRNQVEKHYNKLLKELKRGGWNEKSVTIVDDEETCTERPRSIPMTLKRQRVSKPPFSGYGFEGGFSADTNSTNTQTQDSEICSSGDNQSADSSKVQHLIAKIDGSGGIPCYGGDGRGRIISKDNKRPITTKITQDESFGVTTITYQTGAMQLQKPETSKMRPGVPPRVSPKTKRPIHPKLQKKES